MRRFVSRSLKCSAIVLALAAAYFLLDRARYERQIERLYITFDDFTPEYTTALQTKPIDTNLKGYDYSTYPPADPEEHIPPIIHFIWYKNLYGTKLEVSDIPSHGSDAPRLCRDRNPEFEIKVWNASTGRDLIEEHYDWFLSTYDNYAHPIQRVDAIKYFILYHHGGFYLDLDIDCARSLKPLQRFPAWIPRASPQGLNNDALATRAGHPAWKLMTEMLIPRDMNLIFPYLTIFFSTGPQFATDVLKQYLNNNPKVVQYVPGSPKIPTSEPDAVYILPKKFYSERYTFFGHSPGGTWHEGDVTVVLWFVARPLIVLAIMLSAVTVPLMLCIFLAVRKRRLNAIGKSQRSRPSSQDRALGKSRQP